MNLTNNDHKIVESSAVKKKGMWDCSLNGEIKHPCCQSSVTFLTDLLSCLQRTLQNAFNHH